MMNRTMKNTVRFAALLCAAMLLLSACGQAKRTESSTALPISPSEGLPSEQLPDSTPTPTPIPTPTPSPTPTPTPTPTPSVPVENGQYVTNTELLYTPFYPEEKLVAFTFDDGPTALTPEILSVLKGEDHVTFFVNGYAMDGINGAAYQEYLKQAHESGNEIGIHTYGHVALYDSAKQQHAQESVIAEQLLKIDDLVCAVTGEKPWLMRPPGGEFVRGRNYGYAVVHWSVDTEDWRFKSRYKKGELTFDEAVQGIYDQNIDSIASGDIVLMHDNHAVSVAAFEKLYTELKARGYRLVTVSELLNIRASDYAGYYFHSTGSYGYSTTKYTLSRSSGKVTAYTYSYSFEITSPVLKREE